MAFWTYLLRCADNRFYAGHTDDLEQRLAAHQSGSSGGYTERRRPVTLAWSEAFASREEALAAERQIKGWSRAKKEALIAGDWAAVRLLAKRTILRDAALPGSAAPQDERLEHQEAQSLTVRAEERTEPMNLCPSNSARAEERLSAGEDSSRSTPTSPPLQEAHARSVRAEEALSAAEACPEQSRRAPSRSTAPPPPVIVLVRPQLGENIGKAARAMLNFGLAELRLVAPRDGWPNPAAGPAASGADRVLADAAVYPDVAAAVADCVHVYATTVRRRGLVKPVVTPAEAAAAIHAEPGRSAILFGPERSGLETEDVAIARTILTVPINPEFGSLNLAQAVILVAYEWSKGEALAQPTRLDHAPAAPQSELDGLIRQLDGMLDAAGYFFPPDRAPTTRQMLRSILTKPGWNAQEVRTLRGVLTTLARPRPR